MSDVPNDNGESGDTDGLDDPEAPGVGVVEDDEAVEPPEPNEPA